MQCPYVRNGKVGPSAILFGNNKASSKTSVEFVEPSSDNPPVIHQDESPTLARKMSKFLFYKYVVHTYLKLKVEQSHVNNHIV